MTALLIGSVTTMFASLAYLHRSLRPRRVVFRGVQSQIAANQSGIDTAVRRVSHELRTPLTSIYGALKLVNEGAMGPLSGDVKEVLGIACENSERLIALVNDLLEAEKTRVQGWKLSPQYADIREIVSVAVRALSPMIGGGNIHVEAQVPSAEVFVDVRRIEQVLLNVLGNAIRVSPPFGRIVVGAEVSDSDIAILVDDEGPGVDDGDHERIFEPFEQGRQYAGGGKSTGLGLAISREIVANHGGEMWVDRSPQGGARFGVRLPRVARTTEMSNAS